MIDVSKRSFSSNDTTRAQASNGPSNNKVALKSVPTTLTTCHSVIDRVEAVKQAMKRTG